MVQNTKHQLYHITHLENLSDIVGSGGLQATNFLRTQPTSVAYGHIQQRRAVRLVPVNPRGVLHDYVPFYFCPRSPMLYAIHKPNLEQMPYRGGQAHILHLVASLEVVATSTADWVFTDRHAARR